MTDTAKFKSSRPRKRKFKPGDMVKIRMGNSASEVRVLEARGLGPNGEVMLLVALNIEASMCARPTTFEIMGYSVL